MTPECYVIGWNTFDMALDMLSDLWPQFLLLVIWAVRQYDLYNNLMYFMDKFPDKEDQSILEGAKECAFHDLHLEVAMQEF